MKKLSMKWLKKNIGYHKVRLVSNKLAIYRQLQFLKNKIETPGGMLAALCGGFAAGLGISKAWKVWRKHRQISLSKSAQAASAKSAKFKSASPVTSIILGLMTAASAIATAKEVFDKFVKQPK